MKHKRVVLDTNVLVSALMTPSGNPAKVHKMFLAEELTLVYSDEILFEYEEVLHRSHLRIPAEDADTVLEAIRQRGDLVASTPSTISMSDEDDQVFYDVAKCTGAYLVTGNTRHYPSESFILTPTEFLDT
jgi:putative PIN family toxin of toxin-antitoxin system